MKILKNILRLTLVSIIFIFTYSCESTELDLTKNPNFITPETADPDFLLNQMQLDLSVVFGKVSDETMRLTRSLYMFDAYNNTIDGTTLSELGGADINAWKRAYRINGNRLLIEKRANDNNLLLKQRGMARLITAYTFATLVDILGDIPFSQANSDENPNPSLDKGKEVYDKIFSLIDNAILDLKAKSINTVKQDLYYNNDISKWLKLANTLKLKMYNQIRLVDQARAKSGISNLIAENNFIENIGEDFQFQYTTESAIESRHRYFTNAYLGSGPSTSLYMNNSFMRLLKDSNDPRLRYYFYRQSLTVPSGDDLPCERNSSIPSDRCYIGNFYWGRAHASSDGVPADGLARTIYGIYPSGGAFDNDNGVSGTKNPGLGGAGINPIILSSFTKFYKAEAALTLGTSGDPLTLLIEGVENSINKVINFGKSDAGNLAPSKTDVENYIKKVKTDYNNATSTNNKLEVILREFRTAAYGNGIEAYNNYRKTGLPKLASPISPSSFPRSFLLPSTSVTVNPNISVNKITDQVFWDNNPAGFIK